MQPGPGLLYESQGTYGRLAAQHNPQAALSTLMANIYPGRDTGVEQVAFAHNLVIKRSMNTEFVDCSAPSSF
jgi:hypothetical protein